MKESMNNSAVPAAILRKLRLVQKRSMLVQVACALVAAAAVLLAAMGVAMLIDWLATLYDSRWRVVLTTIAISAAAFTSIGWIIFAWRRAKRLDRVAADVDRQTPPLEERWTAMTRLGGDATKPEVVHPAMLRRLSSEAASWEPRIEPDQVVSLSTLMKAMIGLTAVTAVLAVAVVLDSREVIVLARRFWLPSASISATKLVDVSGNVVIARGEPLALNASIDGRSVQNAILFLHPDAKPAQTITLVAERSAPVGFSHHIRSVEEPFTYRFRAGDGQTDWFNVDVADRPQIEAITLVVTPPAYTRQPAKKFDKLPERLSAMRNSRLEVAVRPKAAVETAQLKMDNNKVATLPLGADGWYRWTTNLGESFSITPVLTESHGLVNSHQPKCQLIAYEDQPPVVKVLAPNDRMAVRPNDAIQITFAATDDVGIGAAELVVYQEGDQKEPTQLAAIPIDLGEQQGARSVQQTVDLDLKKFGTQNGAELSYEIRVREDRGTDQTRVASRPSPGGKGSKEQKALAVSGVNKDNMAKQPQEKTSAPAAPVNSVAAASPTSQSSPSESQNSQAPSSATAQNASKENPSTSPNQAAPSKPDLSALAANDKTKPSQSPGNERSQPSDQTTSASPTQTASAKSEPSNKDASAENPKAGSLTAPQTKNPAETPASRTASSGLQSVANNPKAADEKSTNTQSANASPAANPNTAKDAATAKTERPPSSQQPAYNAAQTASSAAQPASSAKQQANSSAKQSSSSAQQATSATQQANSSAQKPNSSAQPANSSQQPNSSAQQASSSPQQPNTSAKMAKQESPKPEMSQTKKPAESPEARTASSGRKSLSADSNPANASDQPAESQQASSPQNADSSAAKNGAMKQDQAADQQPSTASTAKATKNDSSVDKSAASAKQTQSASNAKSQPSDPSQSASSQSTPPPGDNMPKRTLDVVAQSASSQRMRLKVDQWAGSFEGQQRAKLEMAIAPELEALDEKLAKSQRTSRGVLDGLEADHSWIAAYDRDIATAQQLVVDGKSIIDKLVKQSKDTPYAFIGLQLADLDVAHLEPARASFFAAIQSKGDDRTGSVRDGWQHLGRARQLLADLRGQFERSKRDFQLAEAVERAKKMYQVYVENSQALLEMHDTDPDRYNRKMAEFNLDDEYLKRLKEVIKMRTELEAELAKILGDDPRLLRRYMDNLRARSNNLREQLADLSARQQGLNREVRAWAAFSEADRQPMARLLLLQNLQESSKLATSAGELQDRYQSWLPLQKESKDSGLIAVSKQIQGVATAAGELKSQSEHYIAAEQQAAAAPSPVPTPAPAAEATPVAANPQAAGNNGQVLDQIVNQSESLYNQLGQLEVSLRQLASREDQAEIAVFAANRLVQTRRLIADSSAWIRQIKAQKSGSYTGAAEVTQYRLAMKTDELAGKLGNLEQQLAGTLQRPDRSLPEPIAVKAREFMASLDKEAAPNQLAAVYALHSNQAPRATERQQLAGAALVKAEKLYDELMKLVITELDKLPVQDPIASLLEDPTLDELLAQLEQELPLQELLGIPARPSNLRIIGDWMKPGSNGGGGGMQRIAQNQMKQQDKRSQDKLKQAYQRAIARALKETTPKRTDKVAAKSTKLSDWNKLVSHLGDDLRQGRDKAPPEQYRQAIEQYFAQISRVVAEQEKKSP
jgi:hypothetical protein